MCLAGLALQMLEWRDVIELVVQTLGADPQGLVVLLEFLTVLPEEVTEGRKVSLSVSAFPRWLVENAAILLTCTVGGRAVAPYPRTVDGKCHPRSANPRSICASDR